MKASEGLDARARKLYGGMGVYTGEKMFAILLDDVVSLKLSPEDRQEALKLSGAGVFKPGPDLPEMPEYIVMPPTVLDDTDSFKLWLDKSAEYAKSKHRVVN
jgi:DNA transformation protein